MTSRTSGRWITSIAAVAIGLLALLGVSIAKRGERSTVRTFAAAIPATVPAREPLSREPDSLSNSTASTRTIATGSEGQATSGTLLTMRGWRTQVSGIVLDHLGLPVADQEIRRYLGNGEVLTRSRADGTFECETTITGRMLTASSDAYACVQGLLLPARGSSATIVVVPIAHVGGRVVDDSGNGISAEIRAECTTTVLARFPHRIEPGARAWTPGSSSGTDGKFVVPRAFVAPGSVLSIRAAGFATRSIPAPLDACDDLVIVLERSASTCRQIRGRVLHADGTPAAHATANFNGASERSSEDGTFVLAAPDDVDAWVPLVATEAGWQAAVIPDFGSVLLARRGDPLPVELVLARADQAISGRIVDENGRPEPGWSVRIVDPTVVSVMRSPPLTLEELTAPREGNPIENVTHASGAFEVRGLLDRDYVLLAVDRRSLRRIESHPIPAGTRDVTLVSRAEDAVMHVHGRVLARDGTALGEVVLTPQLVVHRDESGTFSYPGSSVTSAADGGFEFPLLPRGPLELRVRGRAVAESTIPLAGLELSQSIDVVVPRLCELRIEAASTAGMLLVVSNSEGISQEFWRRTPEGWSNEGQPFLDDDVAAIYGVSEDIVEVELFGSSGHVKHAVRVAPDRVTVVEW